MKQHSASDNEIFANLRIGEKVKFIRKKNGLTQADLAARLSMTPSAISQIENDIIMPSLLTMVSISEILNKPVEFFIGLEGSSESKGYKFLRSDQKQRSDHEGVNVYRLSDAENNDLNPYLIEIKPGKSFKGNILIHQGREFVYVLNGLISVTMPDKTELMKKGDSLIMDSAMTQKIENRDDDCSELLFILF